MENLQMDNERNNNARTQKYLCELYREGSYHPRHLQLHEVPKSPSPTSYTMPHKTKLIPLEEVFKIVASKVLVKGKHLFQIMTSKQNYSFGTDTSDEAEKWIKTLNEELFGLPKAGVTYQYRVKVEQSCTGSTPYNGDYLLKVYDDMIKLFTPNGIIHTKFSFLIKDIYEIKYQISDTMQKFVTLSVKSVLTDSKVRDVLILNVKSAVEMIKVINHRRKLQDDVLQIDEQSTIKFGDQLTVDDTNSSTAHHSTSKEQNYNQRPDQYTTESDETSHHDLVALNHGVQKFLKRKGIGSQSLPHIYYVRSERQISDELLSESFEKRSPHRQSAFKVRGTTTADCNWTIDDRPPAQLPPSEALDSIPEDQVKETAQSSSTLRPRLVSYDSNDDPNYARVRDLGALLWHFDISKKGKTTMTDRRESNGYVINSLDLANSQQYLQVFAPEDSPKEENILSVDDGGLVSDK
ncbi:uncharacterized protein [Dysidea avara]|uniref:uncharacterized protein isoform X2 n=1 Tax=Dysidea avara TaxID=196820 RepID=UPI003320CD59